MPIIIPGCGRDGSTLLMQLLGTCGQVVLDREREFENRFLTYFLRWAQLLHPAPGFAPASPLGASLFQVNSPLGPLPWGNSPLMRRGPRDGPLWQTCFLTAWREFSRAATQAAWLNSPSMPVRYYAEKAFYWVCEQLTGLLPYREIYTLRDPRDVWCSVLAYNKKRGFDDFGRKPGQGEAEFLQDFLANQKGKLTHIARAKESGTVTIVRYERMVANLTGEAERLGSWLGVRLDADTVAQESQKYRYHMTSLSAQSSVGRWKRELGAGVIGQFLDQLGPLLRQLGYET